MKKFALIPLALLVTLTGCATGDASSNGIIFKRDHYPEEIVQGVRGTGTLPERWTVAFAECNTRDSCSRRPGVADVSKEQFQDCKIGDWFPDCTRKPAK